MSVRTPTQAFAEVASSLVEHDDLADTLLHLVDSCTDVLDVSAVALLVRDASGDLQLLASSSHRVVELELYQVQADSGPCVDTIRTGLEVSAATATQIVTRWPEVGPQIVAAGFGSVHASPLRWRGEPLGGLNIFAVGPAALEEERRVLAQAFADMATVAIVRSGHLDASQALLRVGHAIAGRTVIERAKGILAYARGVDMAGAYDLLVTMSEEQGSTLSHTAADVIRRVQQSR
jgi:transcriptional regulator with GAF, ATPase, and Fis domain